jgi:hypothetical protein
MTTLPLRSPRLGFVNGDGLRKAAGVRLEHMERERVRVREGGGGGAHEMRAPH